MENRSWK